MYGKATYNATKEFIDKYGVAIAQAIKGTGLFFPAVVGQKALESAYGKSRSCCQVLMTLGVLEFWVFGQCWGSYA